MTEQEHTGRDRSEPIEIDLRFRQVSRNGAIVELTPRVGDLLRAFLDAPGQLLTRDHLLSSIWAGVVVEDANLSQSIWVLRKALGDEHKSIIRTVAKSGYVFDPPPGLRVIRQQLDPTSVTVSPASLPVEPTDAHARSEGTVLSSPAAREPVTPASNSPRLWRFAIAASLGLLAVVLGFGWTNQSASKRSTNVTSADELRVAVAQMPGARSDREAAALALVQQRLEWRLNLDPGLRVERQADSGLHSEDADWLILIDGQGNGQSLAMRLRLSALHAQSRSLDARLDFAQPDAAAWDVAEQVADLLGRARLPRREPPLPAAAADAFARGLLALDRHDPGAALAAFQQAKSLAPTDTLVLRHVASSAHALGQMGLARGDAERVLAATEQQPSLADLRVRAEMLEIAQQHELAVDLNRQILERAPKDARIRLAIARNLMQLRQIGAAIAELERLSPTTISATQRMQRAMLLAEFLPALGRIDDARVAAEQAEQLAKDLSWPQTRAQALLAQARLGAMQAKDLVAAERNFAAASAAYREIGDETGALRAEMIAQILLHARRGLADPAQFERQVARARELGNWRLELEAQILLANLSLMMGQAERHSQLLERAAATAATAGDRVVARLTQSELAQRDLIAGELQRAAERLKVILGTEPQGLEAFFAAQRMAMVTQRQGEYAASASWLARAESALGQKPQAEFKAILDCQAGALSLARGELADSARRYAACRAQAHPELAPYAEVGLAGLALARANATGLHRHLDALDRHWRALPPGPQRQQLALEYADLLLRAGHVLDADAVFVAVSESLGPQAPAVLNAQAALGRAEVALEQRDPVRARAALADLARIDRGEDWALRARRMLASARLHDDLEHAQHVQSVIAEARRRGDPIIEGLALETRLAQSPALSAEASMTWRHRLADLERESGRARFPHHDAVAAE